MNVAVRDTVRDTLAAAGLAPRTDGRSAAMDGAAA